MLDHGAALAVPCGCSAVDGMRSTAPRVPLVTSAVFLAIFAYDGIVRPLLERLVALPAIPGGLNALTVILLLFSLSHAWYLLGPRNTAVFFAITAVVSWIFEEVGVGTGLVFGPYHYTSALGVWLGSVPILSPLAWFMMIYPSYVLANLIAEGRPVAGAGSAWQLLGLAALGALVMTAWDLVVDPILSGPGFQAWVWEQGGGYFGIPAQNYLGWLLTTFTVYVLYRLAERRWRPVPADRPTTTAALLPVLAYAAMLSANVLTGGLPDGVIAVAVIAMGMPIVAALIGIGRLRAVARPT